MIYVIVTVEWLIAHGLPVLPYQRKSKDGSKVLMGYEQIVPVISDVEKEEMTQYYWDSAELNEILNSEEWAWGEEELPVDTNFNVFLDVAATLTFARLHVNDYKFSNEQALQIKECYPTWETYFDKVIKEGYIVNYNGNLYRCLAETSPVKEGVAPDSDINNYELID